MVLFSRLDHLEFDARLIDGGKNNKVFPISGLISLESTDFLCVAILCFSRDIVLQICLERRFLLLISMI